MRGRWAQRSWRGLQAAIALLIVSLVVGNVWVVRSTEHRLYRNFATLPDNAVGLVLGTSPFTSGGGPNPHFAGRIGAAVELYQLGRVKHLIVSGANPDASYNEPRRMWQALTAAGLPAQAITMDFGGLRTFDSVARAKLVFGLERLTLITQDYHAHRALFIAEQLGLDAVAYAPAGEAIGPALRPYLREVAARVWAILDLFVLGTKPRFLGERETLPTATPATLNETESEPGPALR